MESVKKYSGFLEAKKEREVDEATELQVAETDLKQLLHYFRLGRLLYQMKLIRMNNNCKI